MVRHSIDGNRHGSLVSDDSRQIRVDLSRNLTGDHRFAVLSREHDVGEDRDPGLKSGAVNLDAFSIGYDSNVVNGARNPGLKSWAADLDAFNIGCDSNVANGARSPKALTQQPPSAGEVVADSWLFSCSICSATRPSPCPLPRRRSCRFQDSHRNGRWNHHPLRVGECRRMPPCP